MKCSKCGSEMQKEIVTGEMVCVECWVNPMAHQNYPRIKIWISDLEDIEEIARILFSNGYSTRRIIDINQKTQQGIEFWKED